MKNLLQKIKTWAFGRSGGSISSSAPESDFKPKHTEKPGLVTTGYTVSIDEPTGRPNGPGWVQLPSGDWTRKIKCGGNASEVPQPERPTVLNPNNKFRDVFSPKQSR